MEIHDHIRLKNLYRVYHYLKNLQSKDGHKLDLWAGEVNKLGVICGFMIYIFNTTLSYQFIYLLFFQSYI